MPKHPKVVIELPEVGNTYTLASRTRAALKRSGVSNEDCAAFFLEATSGDYNHAVKTVKQWITTR